MGSSAGVLRAARDIMPRRRTATTAVEQLADLAGLGHEPDQAVLIPNADGGGDAAFQGESCSSHAGEGREDNSGAETLHFAGVWFEEKTGSMCSKRVTWVQTNGSGVNQECNQTKAEY